MPLNEPRIYTPKPKWADLTELSRTDTEVWFRTSTGRMMVPLKYVEDYEKKND